MKYFENKQCGFSLIEVLVSLLVMSIGLMGLAGLQMAGLKGSNDAHYRTQASLLMMDMAERMRANPIGVAEGKYRSVSSTLNCASPPTRRCDTVNCSVQQLALFDKYMVTCGVRKLLPQADLDINCAGNDCRASDLGTDSQLNKTHKIVVSWKEAKTSEEDLAENEFKTRTIELDVIP